MSDPIEGMTIYRERLSPPPWLYLTTALVLPAALIVFLPIAPTVGFVAAPVLYLGIVATLYWGSPVLAVREGTLFAGRASIPVALTTELEPVYAEAATAARGPGLDARAWLCIRGWVQPVLRIGIADPDDPAPYWLVSSRHPEQLAEAIARARASDARL